MARNALSGLQASLLARSGINLGEAFLLHDAPDPNAANDVDAFTEEWCPDPSPDGHACRIDETSGQVLLPPNMRLRVQIIDEGGKLNLNAVAFRNKNECDNWNNLPEGDPKRAQLEFRRSMLEALLTDRGVPPEVVDDIFAYWSSLCQARFGNASAGPTPLAGAGPTPPIGSGPGTGTLPPTTALPAPFASLDDAAVIPSLTPNVIQKLRPVLTALPVPPAPYSQLAVNVNTAPTEVLNAIVNNSDVVSKFIEQRSQAPLTRQNLDSIVSALRQSGGQPAGQPGGLQNFAVTRQMLGVTSQYFQVRASGVVNPNPVTGRGGIGRSANMLVRRIRRPQSQVGGASAVPWTLTQLDWQKEGGAALFQVQGDQEPGMADQAAPGSGG
jgi:type II secretory pathway component PulK